MTYENRRGNLDPNIASSARALRPIIAAAVVVLLLLWAFVPRNKTTPVNDTTNAGPSTQTVTPAPSTTTSAPTPNPTTEQPNTAPAP